MFKDEPSLRGLAGCCIQRVQIMIRHHRSGGSFTLPFTAVVHAEAGSASLCGGTQSLLCALKAQVQRASKLLVLVLRYQAHSTQPGVIFLS